MKIIIFGGGISGLTTAHVLIEKGFNVELYESEPIIGGMARSCREPITNIPTEHSWRGYAPFYRNFYRIAQEIPTRLGKTVVDNLADHVKFFMLGVDDKNKNQVDLKSKLIILYILGKAILSDKRGKKDYQKAIAPFLKKYLSKNSYDYLIKFFMGPGWGMDKDTASLGHYAKFTEFSFFQSGGQKLWKVMKGPTQEMWFEPWQKFLKQQGVIFHLNSSLKYITKLNNKIYNCTLSNGTQIQGDDYVFCINPFNLENILSQSPTIPRSLTLEHTKSNDKSDYEMIAFFLAFTEKIEFEYPLPAFIMVDGPLTITFYPQDYFWNEDISLGHTTPCGKPIKSLWSGTCITTADKVQLYPKKGIELSIEELKQEIIHEIFSSADIREKKNVDSLYDIIIWYEWDKKDLGPLTPQYKKFANNIYNQKYRLSQTTQIPNMYIGGAHTQTTIDVWSMEGAVESGIKVSNNILEKYKLPKKSIYIHQKTSGIINTVSQIDNLLYNKNLPHIIDIILIILIIFLIIIFCLFRKKK